LPDVLLTLLSIIQALALELLWGRIKQSDFLFAGGMPALLGWLQVVAVVQGILLVWVLYSELVMRFAWAPSTRDSIFPFMIGLLEFSMIETIGLEHPALWLTLLGLIFAVATVSSNDVYRRVLADAEALDLGVDLPAPTWREALLPAGFVSVLLIGALATARAGEAGTVALLSFAAANGVLFAQGWIVHGHWVRMMHPDFGAARTSSEPQVAADGDG